MKKYLQNDRFLLNYSFIILGFCSILTFFELLARLFYPELLLEQKMFKNSDFMDCQVLKENLDMALKVLNADVIYEVRTNTAGFRMLRELPDIKKNNEKRILCLGDSFTFGFGVNDNETYPFLLEKLLKNRYNSFPIHVINAGFACGRGTGTEYLFLKTNINKLKPNIVILGFHLSDDLMDVERNKWITDINGLPVKIRHPGSNIPWFIKHHSAAYQLLKVKAKLYEKLLPFTTKKQYLKAEYQPTFNQHTWEKIERLLTGMKHIAESNNATLLIASFPEQIVLTNPQSNQAQYELKINQHLKNFCAERSIEFIDLVDAFKSRPRNKLDAMYIPVVGHWSKYGTAACTIEIFKYLESKGKITSAMAHADYVQQNDSIEDRSVYFVR